MDIETFTPEQIAVIAEDKDRVPSSNDLFVRYEDHVAALVASRGEAIDFMPPAALPDANSRGSLR